MVPYYRHVQSLGEPTEGKKEKGKKKEKEKKSKQSGLKSADETKSHGANDVASGSSEIVGREDLEEKPPTPLQKLEDTEEPLSYINERYGAELVGKEDLEAEEKPPTPLEDTEEPSEDPLTRELAEKEAELHQLLESEVDLVESKGKEMSSLLSAVDELEDKKHDVDKKVAEIDSQMAELQTRKDQLVTYKEDKERKLEKLLKKKNKLEKFIEEKVSENKKSKRGLEKEIKEIKVRFKETQRARKSEAQPESLKLLMEYINDQIESKEKELECPVCMEVASAPLFCCDDQHLICAECRPKVRSLPFKVNILFQVSTCPERDQGDTATLKKRPRNLQS